MKPKVNLFCPSSYEPVCLLSAFFVMHIQGEG